MLEGLPQWKRKCLTAEKLKPQQFTADLSIVSTLAKSLVIGYWLEPQSLVAYRTWPAGTSF